MPRVLIAGCGYVGTATADRFHAAQWEVEGWTRSAESAAQLAQKPYRVRAVDLASRAEVTAASRGFDVVVHCASSGGGGVESYRHVYRDGAQNLLEALRPDIFIFTSSTSVYAQTDGGWVNEESAAEPLLETGAVLREAEEFVRRTGGVIARLAGIYGPGRSALLRKFLSGEAKIEGDGKRFLNHVHRDDAAAALFFLASLPNEQHSAVYNVTDNQPITQRAAYEWLAARFKRALPETAVAAATRKRGASNKRVSNRKLRALGWAPKFPSLQSGMEKSVIPALPALRA